MERAFIAEKVGDFDNLNEHFIYLIRHAKSNFLKGIDSRFYADDLDFAKAIAASKLKNTMDSSNALHPQDLLKNDYVRLKTLIDIGVMTMIKGEATDLHGEHEAIANICKLAKKYRKALGLTQGRNESPMQFVSRLLDCFGYGFKASGQITNEEGKKENRYKISCKGGDTLLPVISATHQIPLQLAEDDKITTFTKAIANLGDLVPTEFKTMKLNKRNCTQKKYKALLMTVSSQIFNELQDGIKGKIEHQKTGRKTLFLSAEPYTGKGMCKITTSPTYSLNK